MLNAKLESVFVFSILIVNILGWNEFNNLTVDKIVNNNLSILLSFEKNHWKQNFSSVKKCMSFI